MCMALDRSSGLTEGFLIGNEATLQRLILGKGAPHGALAKHIWAHVAIEGNICDVKPNPDFKTGVIWFARGHLRGPKVNEQLEWNAVQPGDKDLLGFATRICRQLQHDRLHLRDGGEARHYLHTESTKELWLAAREEHHRILGEAKVPA